ncbi:lipopolysaccharide biosynthesis protein [Mesorhizobium sp. M0306]|uniref:lipopolysaccharide biosynthesis protein n=1 Tax=unclassified Mesorhizobium TaxID=325217 RepID=UPI003337E885
MSKSSEITSKSLSARSLSGLAWVSSGTLISSFLRVGVVAILARLLAPESFGVVAAVLVVCAFVEVFGQIGVAPALVQMDEVGQEDVATALAISLSLGLAAAGAIIFSAALIGQGFNMPEIVKPLRLVALIFPLRALGMVSSALVQRALKFRAMSLIDLNGYVFGYTPVSIALAYYGFGYWAMIWGYIAQTAVSNVGYILNSPHSFRLSYSHESARKLLRFGGGITLARIASYIGMNVDYFVVGRFLGPAALGYYSRAFYLMQQPTKLIGNAADQVLFPIFSSIKKEEARIVRVYYLCTAVVFVLSSLASFNLFLLSSEFVNVLLGNAWASVVLPFQLFCLSMPFRIAWKTSSTLIRSKGAILQLVLWQLFYAFSVLVAALIGSSWGINGVAMAVSIAMVLNYWASAAVLATLYPVRLVKEAFVVMKALGVAALAASCTWAILLLPGIREADGLYRLVIGGIMCGLELVIVMLSLELVFPEEGRWLKERLGITKYLPASLRSLGLQRRSR